MLHALPDWRDLNWFALSAPSFSGFVAFGAVDQAWLLDEPTVVIPRVGLVEEAFVARRWETPFEPFLALLDETSSLFCKLPDLR